MTGLLRRLVVVAAILMRAFFFIAMSSSTIPSSHPGYSLCDIVRVPYVSRSLSSASTGFEDYLSRRKA